MARCADCGSEGFDRFDRMSQDELMEVHDYLYSKAGSDMTEAEFSAIASAIEYIRDILKDKFYIDVASGLDKYQ